MALSAADQRAMRTGISVGIAVAAYGVSFGALSVAAGLDVWQTCFLSLVLFSGGSQFAVIGIIASGGAAAGIPAIASSTFLALRNGIYSMRVAPIVGSGPWWRRLAAAQLTIDESTAVAIAQDEKKRAEGRFLDHRYRDLYRLEPRHICRSIAWEPGGQRQPIWFRRGGCRSVCGIVVATSQAASSCRRGHGFSRASNHSDSFYATGCPCFGCSGSGFGIWFN